MKKATCITGIAWSPAPGAHARRDTKANDLASGCPPARSCVSTTSTTVDADGSGNERARLGIGQGAERAGGGDAVRAEIGADRGKIAGEERVTIRGAAVDDAIAREAHARLPD